MLHRKLVPELGSHHLAHASIADPGEEYGHYAESLEAWLDTFPSEQIHVVQFEELQEDTEAVLRRLKVFLGMDPNLPQMELRNVNSRAVGGYPIEKAQYEELVTAVQPDVAQVGRLLRKYGLGDADAFVGRWKAVWESRLATCSQDMCTIDSN